MVIDDVNTLIRNMFNSLINNGFKRLPMAEVTLGKSFSPQFNKFLSDADLGLVPLTRMVNGLGYELHVVPIKSDNEEFKKVLDKQYESFLETSKNDLIDHIENRPTPTRVTSTGKASKVFDNVVDELLNDLD
jgi:hypothetical protein